ncbi:hypothetical protein [Rufibacter sp. LB8]|uniref:hypothetical protein n=1 Tax=Rufibacter sp. LB8 TaxID=2777781 RepID=UPI00178C6749|nr:hypothetical protein [Rufibacter sp. LB8]
MILKPSGKEKPFLASFPEMKPKTEQEIYTGILADGHKGAYASLGGTTQAGKGRGPDEIQDNLW